MIKRSGSILGLAVLLSLAVVPGMEAPDCTAAEQTEATVNFMFDAVDIPTFVKIVGEISGKRFVVDSAIQGKITIVSPKVARQDVYPLFISILESSGCSVVEDGDVLRVVKLKSQPLRLAEIVGPGEQTPEHGVITKILRLEHVSADEVRKVLDARDAKGVGGSNVKAIAETNYLIVTDTADNIRRVEQLVAKIDLPGLARVTDVVPLKYASAEELATQLNMAITENTSRAEQLRQRMSFNSRSGAPLGHARAGVVVASPHSNSLIVVGSASQVKSLRDLIGKMDVDVPSGRGRLNAIFLNYLVAEEAAKNISDLLAQKRKTGKGHRVVREIAIEASPSCNALLVDARPGDFEIVRQLVEQLDKQPQQVHINVLIMEINGADGLDFGVNLASVDKPSTVGDSVVQGTYTLQDGPNGLLNKIQDGIFPNGLSIGVAHGTSLAADGTVQVGYPGLVSVTAVKKNRNFKVVSESSLQAQNNKPADLSVVNQIPVLTSKISGGTGSSRDVIQNIDRIDVGVKLKITPHIIPGNRISMDLNPSIEAVIDNGPPGTVYTPTIARRQVNTTVSIDNGRTIVIAGLTRRDKRKVEHRVPFLGSIPVLGWLFRRVASEDQRTDIVIFVTPTIVSTQTAADKMRSDWEQKTGLRKTDARVDNPGNDGAEHKDGAKNGGKNDGGK